MAGIGYWELADALAPTDGERSREATATVVRVDHEGVVWCAIPGGSDEFPCTSALASVQPGDVVKVRVEKGVASVTGNATSPAVGMVVVSEALTPVEQKATDALAEAQRAHDAADAAEVDAGRAHVAADSAELAATDANRSARQALLGLSTVEDVVNVLEWLSAHSKATTDTVAEAGKAYYRRDATTGTMTRYEVPEGGDPSALGLYELDDAVAQYLAAHLIMTDHGLNLKVADTGGYIHLGTLTEGGEYGTYILDEYGRSVARLGEHTRIGRADKLHIDITDGAGESGTTHKMLSIASGSNAPVMYVEVDESTGESTVYMTNAVVVSNLRFGDWMWYQRPNGNMSVRWVGE